MNWYMQKGKENDAIVCTKVVFSRNLRNFKFATDNTNEVKKIEEEIKLKLPQIGYNLKFFKIQDMDILTRKSLVEKELITDEVAKDEKKICSILVNDEENICIILNNQDHIEIQVFNSGEEIWTTFNLAREISEKFEQNLDIAKSKKYGYLTTYPINVGTGMKITCKMHLPGLTKTGNIRKIIQSANSFGLNFSGKYIQSSEIIGDMYQISNKQTLGISEETIAKNIKAITEKIIEQERKARKILAKNEIELQDNIFRCYGILSNCKKIKWQESMNLLSNIKMGTDLGIIDKLNDEKILKMYFYINSANLQKYYGEKLEAYDRDIKRAQIIKQIIDEK